MSFASSEFLTAFEEVGAKVVDLVVESSDLSHIVAFVECSPATSADVDVEAGDKISVICDADDIDEQNNILYASRITGLIRLIL